MARLILLIVSASLLFLAIVMPKIKLDAVSYDYVFIIDITSSMNTQDYTDAQGFALSRLDKVKQDIIGSMNYLPCGSRIGIGLFTERNSALLFSPIEICNNYSILANSIEHLDWRMAWVADSNIRAGLYNTIRSLKADFLNDSKLVFFTDGHEAPPPNTRYQDDFSELFDEDIAEDWRTGLIVGVGQKGLSQIPKFDEEGNQVGFYQVEDVPHATTFGLPADPSKIEGYVPRNGPWGTAKKVGTEHLSSLKKDYLLTIAEPSKMLFHHLQSAKQLAEALKNPAFSKHHPLQTNISYIPAALALLLFCLNYLIGWHQRSH